MGATGWSRRFLASTRGRIVQMLRSTARTVNELAGALDLTDNAVRAHLTALERDGLVRLDVPRRGVRKPHQTYRLTPEAEDLFPKAYGPVLCTLLQVLSERLPAEQVDGTIREVGRRVAAECAPYIAAAPFEERVRAAVRVLEDLGGQATCEERDGRLIIRGQGCPLASAVRCEPLVCHAAETLVSEILGVPVHEHCDRTDNPQCCFEAEAPEPA